MASFRASRKRAEISPQRASALSSDVRCTPSFCSSAVASEAATIAALLGFLQWLGLGKSPRAIKAYLQGFHPSPHAFPQVWKGCLPRPLMRLRGCGLRSEAKSLHRSPGALLYTGPPAAPAAFRHFFSREANVSAERAPAEAPARIPGANVDSRGPRDPQAPPRQGAQAPLRVSGNS